MAGTPYFFLSYAHSGPSSEAEIPTTDHGVSAFFRDLSSKVAAMANLPADDDVGFYDGLIKAGDDWNAAVSTALGTSRVFVALYSPSYFNKAWTMRERESFRRRLDQQGVQDLSRYLVPVLWTPFAPWDIDDDIGEALALANDIPEYLENGLRALGMLSLFREQYKEIVSRVVTRIVESATHDGALEPSVAPQVPEMAPRDAEFVVAVIAPSAANLPSGRSGHDYGDASILWRPFGQRQAMPIAAYAEGVAERLGSATVVSEFDQARAILPRRPGLVLIDPWFIRTLNGRQALKQAVTGLPIWATPLVIDGYDPSVAEENAVVLGEVQELLESVGQTKVRVVSRLEDFVDFLPELITQARRRFLKHSPLYDQAGPTVERYTLRNPYVPPAMNGNVDQ